MTTEQLERLKSSAHDKYSALVFDIVEAGTEHTDAYLLQVATEAGFSAADLLRHVRQAKTRYQAAIEDAERGRELSVEAGAFSDTAAKLDREFKDLAAAFEKAAKPIEAERDSARQQGLDLRRQAQGLSTNAKNTLTQTLPPGWRAELDRLALDHGNILTHLPTLQKRRGELEPQIANLESLEYRLENSPSPQITVAAEKDLDSARAAKAEYDALTLQVREIQDQAQAAKATLEEFAATGAAWKTVEFQSEAEELVARERARNYQAESHDRELRAAFATSGT